VKIILFITKVSKVIKYAYTFFKDINLIEKTKYDILFQLLMEALNQLTLLYKILQEFLFTSIIKRVQMM